MGLQIATVSQTIADSLSVAGLEIFDVDEIPIKTDVRQVNMIPLQNFISNFVATRDSFGGGSTALQTVEYQLNYRLLYSPPSLNTRGLVLENPPGLVDIIVLFFDAVLAIDVFSGAVDITPAGIANMGVVNDPSESEFVGVDVSFAVQEFVN